MKRCSKCGKEKELSEFYFKKTENRYNSFCNTCLYQYQTKRWIERKIWAINYKGGICERCKQSFPYYVFEFHHTNPKLKEFDWTKMRLISIDKLTQELDKCILVCSNCHRIIEHEHL